MGARYLPVLGSIRPNWVGNGKITQSPMHVAILFAFASLIIALIIIVRRRKASAGGANEITYEGAIKAIRDGRHPALERFIPYLPPSSHPEPAVSLNVDDTIPIGVLKSDTADHQDRPCRKDECHD